MLGELDKDTFDLLTTASMKAGNNWGTGVILYNPVTNMLLIGKRTDTHDYCTPGGKVEVGESPLQGVVRECYEESNLMLKSTQFIGYRAHTAPNGKNWISFMFFSTDFEGDIKPQQSEIESWDWVTVDEALMLNLFPPTQASLEVAMRKGVIGTAESFNGCYGVCEETINGDGNGDTMKLPLIDQLPKLTELYKNGRPDHDECSYSCMESSMWDSPFPYPYIMD